MFLFIYYIGIWIFIIFFVKIIQTLNTDEPRQTDKPLTMIGSFISVNKNKVQTSFLNANCANVSRAGHKQSAATWANVSITNKLYELIHC